jgi:hypothetical protein
MLDDRNSLRLVALCMLAVAAALLVDAASQRVSAQIQPTERAQPMQATQPLGAWHGANGRAPDANVSSECRDQARRVNMQMPSGRSSQAVDEDQRYEHEARLYDQCMRSKGLTR